MREILSWILCTAFTAHTARLLSMASLSLTKARPIQTDRWLYFHAREFRKRPSRFIIWHAVTKPTRPNPRIFAIFKSTDACHYIIHARYTVKTDIRGKNWKFEAAMCKFREQILCRNPLAPLTRRQCILTLRCNCNFHVPCHLVQRGMPISLEFRESCYPSDSIGIYTLHFRAPRTQFQGPTIHNPATCERPFPNFHTSDLWSRTCDRLGESWRRLWEIGKDVYTFQIPRMFRTACATLYFEPSPNYGYSASEVGLFSSREQRLPATRRSLSLPIPNYYRL